MLNKMDVLWKFFTNARDRYKFLVFQSVLFRYKDCPFCFYSRRDRFDPGIREYRYRLQNSPSFNTDKVVSEVGDGVGNII